MDVGCQPPAIPGERRVGRSAGPCAWDIENHRFNELANRWHADPAYKQDPTQSRRFVWFHNFHAFLIFNLKPECRKGKPERFQIRVLIPGICSHDQSSKRVRAP